MDWTDLGREMWSFLTGREAAINYRFIDMAVEVPRDTGAEAPRATWKLNGTLQVTTKDNASTGTGERLSLMANDLTVDADLELLGRDPRLAHRRPGSLTGSGKTLELRVSDPFVFAGTGRRRPRSEDWPTAGRSRPLASPW